MPGVREDGAHRASSASGWFLAENGSMLGGITSDARARRAAAARRRRARTRRPARLRRYGARKRQPRSTSSLMLVVADVAAPDDVRAARAPAAATSAGRLRIVHDDDVARAHHRRELARRSRARRARRARCSARRAASRRRRLPWMALCSRLVSAEELGRPFDHDPARVDAGAARVGEQRAHHLGDAAADRRRADVPHHAPLEQRGAARPRARSIARISSRPRTARHSDRATAGSPGESEAACR